MNLHCNMKHERLVILNQQINSYRMKWFFHLISLDESRGSFFTTQKLQNLFAIKMEKRFKDNASLPKQSGKSMFRLYQYQKKQLPLARFI